MGKHKTPSREKSDVQKLAEENRTLKKVIKHLRKELSKVDGARFDLLKEHLDEQEFNEKNDKTKEINKNQWKCFKCQNGVLRLIIYENRSGVSYIRKCSSCDHRTKSQKYTQDVKE